MSSVVVAVGGGGVGLEDFGHVTIEITNPLLGSILSFRLTVNSV